MRSFDLFKAFVFFFLLTNAIVFAINKNDFVKNYFSYKQVPSVVGFSCESVESDMELLKSFTKLGIYSMIHKINATESSDLSNFISAAYHSIGVFVDFQCGTEGIPNLFSKASERFQFGELHHWLIFSSGDNLTSVVEMVNDDAFGVSTEFVVALNDVEVNEGYTLYDLYNPYKLRGTTLNTTLLGHWSPDSGFKITLTQHKIHRRSNLHGLKLKFGGLVKYQPKNIPLDEYLQDYTTRSKDSYAKFTYVYILHLGDLYNYTIDYTPVANWDPSNKVGPIIAGLYDKTIDFSGNPSVLTPARIALAKPIAQVWPFWCCFFLLSTHAKTVQVNGFVDPLATECWYASIFLVLVATFALACILHLEVPGVAKQYGVAFFLILSSICQQGSVFLPKHISGRIAYLHIMFFGLLIYNYYSASIVAVRLKDPLGKMNNSLRTLADSGLDVGAERALYLNFLFLNPDPDIQYFHKKRWVVLPDSNKYYSPEEGIKKVSKGNFAFHTEAVTGYPLIERQFSPKMICQLTEICLYRDPLIALFTNLESPIMELWKIGLLKIRHSGIQRRELQRWYSRKPLCDLNLLTAERITIYESAPIFIFLFCAAVFSLAICFMERQVYQYMQNNK